LKHKLLNFGSSQLSSIGWKADLREEEPTISRIKAILEIVGTSVAAFGGSYSLLILIEAEASARAGIPVSVIGDRIFSLILLGLTSLIASLALFAYRHYTPTRSVAKDARLADSMLDSIEKAYNARKWQEVIKIGSVLSRPLWLTGHYDLRVKIGEYVESAAAFSKEDRVQAAALIDDLGWTNVVLGNFDKAKSYIEHGMKIATERKDFYLVSKAYRHLSGISLRKKNFPEAELMFDQARKALLQVQNTDERKELDAGLLVNIAMLKMDQGQWPEAISDLKQARDIYRTLGDEDREVKLFAFEGNCYLNLRNTDEALDSFRDGLEMAEKRCRKDAILSNLQGIGRVYLSLVDYKNARKNFQSALALATEIKDQASIEDLEKELKSVDRKLRREHD
jgi:tetratricopeptide (TPR) repeat protein